MGDRSAVETSIDELPEAVPRSAIVVIALQRALKAAEAVEIDAADGDHLVVPERTAQLAPRAAVVLVAVHGAEVTLLTCVELARDGDGGGEGGRRRAAGAAADLRRGAVVDVVLLCLLHALLVADRRAQIIPSGAVIRIEGDGA